MSIENLLTAWNTVEWTQHTLPEYRVYYDVETGKVTNYTNEILEGEFITVSREVFAEHRFDVTVRDGKLIKPKPPIGKLVPSQDGVACHKQDVTVIYQDRDSIYWSMKTYEN